MYKTDDFYSPGVVTTHEPFKMGRISGIMLDFFPISYNPLRHSLKLITSATITVKIIQDPVLQKSAMKNPVYNPDLDRVARDIIINYDETDSQIKGTAPLNFLVVAGDQFVENEELKTYLNWKRQCGFNIILKSVTELHGTTSSIKDFIIEQYSSDASPAYVLLVGDVADVPAWTGTVGETETDAPYSRMDGDLIPDLMIGRFSAADDSDLAAIIHKSMAYEMCEVSSLDAFNKMTFIATSDPDYWELAEASHNYVIENYLQTRGVYTDLIKGHPDGNTLDISQALNEGRTICHYSGHGLETEWQGPSFNQGNIGGLNSGSVPAFVISNACETGSFSMGECFGESWIRTADKGAFAFIGASNSSYWEPDDIMERAMYDGFFQDGETSIGAMLYRGLFDVFSQTATGDTSTYKYYYDVYNILGDPSIKPWVGIPKETFADYNPIVALNIGYYSVSVMNESGAMENAVVTLLQNENIVAFGVTGIDGTVTLAISAESLQLGDLLMTITGNQQIPVIDTLTVVNPLNVNIEPATVPVGISSNISVTVLDDSSHAVANAEIYAFGWTVHGDSLLGTSDSDGVLQFQLLPRYGEIIKIKGKISGETGYVFVETLPVTGAAQLSSPEILVGADQFDVENSLVPGHIGQISGSAKQSNITLAVRGCGIDTLAVTSSMQVFPDTIGTLVAALLKSGYEVFEKPITVKKAFGTVSGLTTDTNQQPLSNAMITGYLYPDTLNPVFSATTNNAGEFSYPLPIEVGYYQIRAQLFGYLTQTVIDTIKLGSNVFTTELAESPRVSVSGRVSGGIHERPLNAVLTIEEYSTGTGNYYTSVETFAADNGIYEVALPSGDYEFSVAAMRYIAETLPVNIGSQALEINVHLDTTRASILLVDDDSGKRGIDKNSTYTIDVSEGKSSSAVEIQNVLEATGYYVIKTVYTSGLNTELGDFDMVISSSGSNMNPVENSSYRSMLESYVTEGGRLLIEGGEVGYSACLSPYHIGDSTFAQNVLHASNWISDNYSPLNLLLYDHAFSTSPNVLPPVIDIDNTYFGDQDICIPTSDADVIYFCDSTSVAGIILYEDTDNSIGGRTVFFTFAFDKISSPVAREHLLENTIEYLLREPDYSKGDMNKDGQINVLDLTKVVSLILRINPTGDEFEYWAADLNSDDQINVLDLVWVINIILGREGFAKPVESDEKTLHLSFQNNQLFYAGNSPISALQIEFEPGSVFEIATDVINDESVSIRQENDILLLYSFSDASILSGSGSLGTLSSSGNIVSAMAVDRFGRQIQTTLKTVPDQYKLYQNYPNPFNSKTVIRFDLPQEAYVTLELFDLLGRKLATLLDDKRAPGSYDLSWNGRDMNGRDLASGIYFYALRAGDFYQLRKLALVK
ncbi:MAG: C25 family cysteine peptidase [bacterium]